MRGKRERETGTHCPLTHFIICILRYQTNGIEWIVDSIVITPHSFVCGNGLLFSSSTVFFSLITFKHGKRVWFSLLSIVHTNTLFHWLSLAFWIAYHRMIIKNEEKKRKEEKTNETLNVWFFLHFLFLLDFFCSFYNQSTCILWNE